MLPDISYTPFWNYEGESWESPFKKLQNGHKITTKVSKYFYLIAITSMHFAHVILLGEYAKARNDVLLYFQGQKFISPRDKITVK